jgi:type III restriction enzyme
MVSSLSLYDQRDMRTAVKGRLETLAKLHLGRAWQEQAGPGYRYFLVFQDKDISMTGAYPMSEFLKILAEL